LPIKIPIEESIGKADVIFKGTVLRVDTVKMKYEYAGDSTSQIQNTNHFLLKHLVILKVAKMLKGESKSDTILILTGEGGGDF
jgi:predicted P-loop ATPase